MPPSAAPPVDNTPPVLSEIKATAATVSATVTWITDEQANGSVAFGPTAAYENGSVEDDAWVTSHAVLLPGLLPGTTYRYQVASVDAFGNSASSGDLTFTTVAAPSGILSDDFNHACNVLEDDWSFVDPLGDGAVSVIGGGTQNAQVLISVPAGTNHDPWAEGNCSEPIAPGAPHSSGNPTASVLPQPVRRRFSSTMPRDWSSCTVLTR